MKIMLNSRELFDIVAETVVPTKEIDEIIIKIGMFDMFTLNEEGTFEPYGSREIIIKKEDKGLR